MSFDGTSDNPSTQAVNFAKPVGTTHVCIIIGIVKPFGFTEAAVGRFDSIFLVGDG